MSLMICCITLFLSFNMSNSVESRSFDSIQSYLSVEYLVLMFCHVGWCQKKKKKWAMA